MKETPDYCIACSNGLQDYVVNEFNDDGGGFFTAERKKQLDEERHTFSNR